MPSPTPVPSDTPPPPSVTPQPSPTLSRALGDIQPGEQLELVADLSIPRSGFGVRMAFSPVDPILYHTGVGLEIQGYDFEAEQVVLQISDFQSRAPFVLAVSPDGSLIVAEDGAELRRWDTATGERVGATQMPAPRSPLSAGFLPDGYFYADDESGNIALWQTGEWQELDRLTYAGRNDGAFPLPDREGVVMQIRDQQELSVLDWSGKLIRTVPTNAAPWRLIGLSPSGDQAALHEGVGLGTEGILITDLFENGTSFRIPLLNIRASAISSDWRTLAIADASETLRLYDPVTGRLFHTQSVDALQIDGLTISPDGNLLAIYMLREGEEGGRIQVWGRQQP